jgi:hypothetical protein
LAAVIAKVGINSSSNPASVDYKLSQLRADVDAHSITIAAHTASIATKLTGSMSSAITNAIIGNTTPTSGTVYGVSIVLGKVATAALVDMVDTNALQDAAVTTRKLKPSHQLFTSNGTNQQTTSTTYVDVPGMSTTYTSGLTAETLLIWFTGMIYKDTTGSGQALLNIAGTDMKPTLYTEPSDTWQTQTRMYQYNIAANTTITLKARFNQAGGGTMNFHNGADFAGQIRIIAFSQ